VIVFLVVTHVVLVAATGAVVVAGVVVVDGVDGLAAVVVEEVGDEAGRHTADDEHYQRQHRYYSETAPVARSGHSCVHQYIMRGST
jgi:hypothetical protein